MPEYLSPGVYVEETSFRAKSIEGVATSTCGFVGQARFGPVEGTPQLITSFEEFKRYFGDENPLLFSGVWSTNHLAHGVRLFFENGGARVYVARVVKPAAGDDVADLTAASDALDTTAGQAFLRARSPGRYGNLQIRAVATRSGNLKIGAAAATTLQGVRPGDVVELSNGGAARNRIVKKTTAPAADAGDPLPTDSAGLGAVSFDATGKVVVTNQAGAVDLTAFAFVQKINLNLLVEPNGDGSTGTRSDLISNLSTHPASANYIGSVLRTEDFANGVEPPADRSNRIWFEAPALPGDAEGLARFAAELAQGLIAAMPLVLSGGGDGQPADPAAFTGGGTGHDATGLAALGEVEDIAIVAAPGAAALANADDRQAVRDALITHCEVLKYRFAILAGPQDADLDAIRGVRAVHDSKYAALYYPWVVVRDPDGGATQLSPEGSVAGVYARTDIERGVHKAPANETVRGVLRFSRNVNKGQQDVLNPEGINCLRFFEGRGNRVWGARTISSDPEWTYLNVRRLFIYMEHSIDRGTQWAVFEPNNEQLWLKIRLTIESFLYDTWRTGALMGTKPEQAYFVRCDRTTMSQGDLDNGRLICLIGVAPTKPAEFVIFRIGQWTADASIL
jgi:phage tail sheath protein FI